MTHTLKIDAIHFQAVWNGVKTVELRQEDDRQFAVGDALVLRVWRKTYVSLVIAIRDYREAHPEADLWEARDAVDLPGYTGRSVTVTVTHVLRDTQWLQPGVAALSIRREEPSLEDVRLATNQALARAEGRVASAINWADLACRDVRRWTDDTGASGYAVSIEEAAPDAWELQTFVREYLVEAGFANVEVVTEW